MLMVSVLLRPRQVLTLGSLLTGTRPCYASYFLDKRMAFSVVERGCQNAKDYRVYFSKQQRAIEKASLAQSLCHMCCWYIATLNGTTVLICVGTSQINHHVPGTAPVTYPAPPPVEAILSGREGRTPGVGGRMDLGTRLGLYDVRSLQGCQPIAV